jgi:ankyrin repeat protein
MLLDAKANVDVISFKGTALMAASRHGHLEVVDALIEAGANVNAELSGRTALFLACSSPDHLPVVAALLAARARVGIQEAKNSPLSNAIQSDSIESLKLLIAAGAETCVSSVTDALLSASLFNNIAAAKLLIDAKADVNSVKGTEFSLFSAVFAGNIEMTKLYISAGADVSMRNQSGECCLSTMVRCCLPNGTWARQEFVNERAPIVADRFNKAPADFPGVFKVLVDAKADVSARGPDGTTPLHAAAGKNNVEAVIALCDAGADVNAVNDGGKTPLFAASTEGHLGVVTALLAAGADANVEGRDKTTAMMSAVLNKHPQVVSALLAAGVDVNRTYSDGNMTILDVSMSTDSVEVPRLLKRAGAMAKFDLMVETSGLVRAVSRRDMASVREHAKNASEEEMDMAIAFAVFEKELSITAYLLQAGANPAARYRGMNMLNLACMYGNLEMVRVLIDAGADIFAMDHSQMTATQHASKNKHREVVALLMAKAAELQKTRK